MTTKMKSSSFGWAKYFSGEKWLDVLSWLVIFTLGVSLLLGMFLPLYTDELATKIMQSRFFAEHGRLLTLFPQCESGFISDTPYSWYPAAVIYSFIYSQLEPLGIRIAGVVTSLMSLVVLFYWISSKALISKDKILLCATVAAIFGLGVFPFVLVLARAEQWLVLLIVTYCLFPIISKRLLQHKNKLVEIASFIIFCILTSFFFYTHTKSIFFFPMIFISALYSFGSKHKLLFGLSLMFTVVCAIQTVQYARAAIRCDDAPILSKLLASQTIDMSKLTVSPLLVINDAINNLVSAPQQITRHLVFQSEYQSGWLPPEKTESFSDVVAIVNVVVVTILQGVIWLALLTPLILIFSGMQWANVGKEKLLVCSIWIALVGHLAIYKVWNFYGGALVIPISVALLVISCAEIFQLSIRTRIGKSILLIVFVTSLLSFSLRFFNVMPDLIAIAHSSTNSLPGQPLSVSAFNFENTRARVRLLANECGLQGDGSKKLVVDDMTYFAFDDLQQPLHLVYLYEGGFGADIGGDKLQKFLTKMGSDGIVAQCTYFPHLYLGHAIRDDNICCIRLEKLQHIYK